MPDNVALITGSSSGFGLLTSIELAKAGFRVVATMRDLGRQDRLDQAAAVEAGARNGDVVESREVVDEMDVLEGACDAEPRDRMGGLPRDVPAVERHPPVIAYVLSGDHVQQGRLA